MTTPESGLGERDRRLAKVNELRDAGVDPYPVRFDRTHTAAELVEHWGHLEAGVETDDTVRVAGRVVLLRRMGKLSFATLRDGSGELQLFVSRADLGDERHAAFDDLDLGDWIGAEGVMMKTRRGELSVKVREFGLLSKALRPLPDKWHGLADVDTRFRQRYVDLIANDDARRIFAVRFAVISTIREQLNARELRGSRDAGLARASGWCGGAPVPHAPQRARHAALVAYRARAALEALARGWPGAGVRDRTRVPERGTVHSSQPRVHDARVLSGLR